ncbi:MAG: hypothetical protein ACLUCE_10980 [Streptococcus sp.]|jgi:hypothetical protein|uniref:hypothetical protein n=1 Tax=Bacillota TaxID=1239 RepID=UPI00399445BF
MALSQEEHSILIEWIKANFIPIQSFNNRKTSYGLKHIFERSEHGFYIDNDDFKSAMKECGFRAKDETALNWVFNISQKSPALKR